jgi:deoxyribonuclease IV
LNERHHNEVPQRIKEHAGLAGALLDFFALRLGAHVSIAGGLPRAFERSDELGCEAIQIFTQNGRAWVPPPRAGLQGELREFGAEARRRGTPLLSHASYLVNLATGDRALAARSRAVFLAEIERCEALGVGGLVFHPGAHCGDGVGVGLRRVAAGLRWALARTPGYRVRLLIEVTAGQGTCLGHRFQEVRALLDATGSPGRTGVCFDTCHAWAAGYDLRSPRGYAAVWREFDEVIGLHRLHAFHLNDSRRELGARVDRHERIAEGALGSAPFRRLVRDPRFAGIPAVLELPPEVAPASLERLRSYRKRRHT